MTFHEELGFFLLTHQAFLLVGKGPHNIPHVSLFQAVIPFDRQANLFKKIEKTIISLPAFSLQIEGDLEDRYGNKVIPFVPDDPHAFFSFKTSLIEMVRDVISHKRLAQIKSSQLTEEEAHLVGQFGLYWGVSKQDFSKPHMTVAYQSQENLQDYPWKKGDHIFFDTFGIGLLGSVGNVVKILKTWELKTNG